MKALEEKLDGHVLKFESNLDKIKDTIATLSLSDNTIKIQQASIAKSVDKLTINVDKLLEITKHHSSAIDHIEKLLNRVVSIFWKVILGFVVKILYDIYIKSIG